MCPKSQLSQGGGRKVCVLMMFRFWENGLSGLVELFKCNKKIFILCYYTVHDAIRMFLKNQFFHGAGCKICVPAKFGLWENGLSALVELIKFKQKTSILCYYIVHNALRMYLKNQFFQEAGYKICILIMFGFW